MRFADILCFLGVLCGTVHAALKNYTIDDTAAAVVYSPEPFIRCTPASCDAPWTSQLFNGTSSITDGNITVPFTGTAVYAYLAIVGECVFELDGVATGWFINEIGGDADKIYLSFIKRGLTAGPHTLKMYPAKPGQFLQFDYLVYTNTAPRKANVGAIVGGVVGGLVLAAGLSVGAFFLRRRNQQQKVATRGIPLGDHWPVWQRRLPIKKRTRSSSVPRTRDENADAAQSAPLSPDHASPAAPVVTPTRSPGAGLGLHTAAGLLISPISPGAFYRLPRDLQKALETARTSFPGSSPLTSLESTPAPNLAPGAIIIPTKRISALPIHRTRRQMSVGPTFTGSGTSAAKAIDFLKDVRLGFSGRTLTDTEKLEEVGDRFRHATPADVWFRASKFTAWNTFVTAFEARFAAMVPVVKPRPQLLAELAGMRITVGELAAEYVSRDGAKIAPLVEFAARVREAVLDANAGTETEGVWGFHASLPAVLRVAIGTAPANWDGVLAALDTVPQHAVDVAVEDHKRRVMFEASLGELNTLVRKMRVAPQAPPMAVAPIVPPPNVQNPATGPNPPTTQTGAGGGGGGRGKAREPIPPGTEAQKARLRQIMTDHNARQPPDTPEGRTRYAAQVADWTSKNGHIPADSVAIWSTGYPISPGTALPCSGECWRCGVCTYPVHRVCPAPLIPVLERKYRATCGTWFGRLHAGAAQGGAGVNYVETVEVEGVPWQEAGGGEGEAAGGADF
ncbi:hypothetical protein FB451DRAFT_1563775 [Mycena latifolia]|nr:hypothetical protein FB451DRAFT_1563775 [Mycena latifolia]